jgi:plastocyanin
MTRTALITLLGLGILAAPAGAADHNITVANNAFTPADITINQGDNVNWNWTGPDGNHSTTTDTSQSETWDSDPNNPFPNHPAGFRFSWTFQKVGKFAYFCKVHPSTMRGTVDVLPLGQPVPPPADTVAPQFGTPRVSVVRRRVTFKLDEVATVVGRLRGKTRKTIELDGTTGTNVMKLPRMKPGRYGLALRATDGAGNKSTTVQVKFTVRRPKKR